MEEGPKVYVIPANISDDGGFARGMIKKRNGIEAIVIFFIMLSIWFLFTAAFNVYIRFATFIFVIVPPVIAIIGIKDKSLCEYILEVFSFKKKRRKMVYKMPRRE